jgi:hypothetical protein
MLGKNLKKRKRDEYTAHQNICEGRRKILGDATNAEIFPPKHLVCQLGTEGEAMTSRLSKHVSWNAIYTNRKDIFCHLLETCYGKFISPFYYMIIP